MLDTKQSWDDLVLRHAKDEETAYRILENRLYHNLTARFVQSHDYIAMERLYEIHASGEYDLIVIDTPPTRNAIDFLEAPGAHGRLLRRPAAALAHAAVPRRRQARRAACSTSRAGPSTNSPTASSAASSSKTSPSSSCNFQSMYDGFVERAQRGRAAAARPAHDVRGRHHARSRAAARSRALLRGARRPRVPPRRARAQQDACPTTCSTPTARRRRPRSSTTPGAIAEALVGARRIPRSPIRRASPGCCARSASRSRNFSVVAMREAELRAELARRARRRRARARASSTTSATSTALAAIAPRLFGDVPRSEHALPS